MKIIICFCVILLLNCRNFAGDCNRFVSKNDFLIEEIETTILELKADLAKLDSEHDFDMWICKKRQLAGAYTKKGFYKIASSHLEEALEVVKLNHHVLQVALVRYELGYVYKVSEEYNLTLENYLISADLLESLKSWELLMTCNVSLAEYYRRIAVYDKALEYIDKALIDYNDYNVENEYVYCSALGRKAAILNETGLPNQSIKYSLKVLEFGIVQNDLDIQAMAHNEIGFSYLNLLKGDSSMFHYQKAENLWLSNHDSIDAARAKYNKAVCFARNTSDRDSVIGLLRDMISFVDGNNLDYPLFEAYQYLYKEFETIKVFDSALYYQKIYYEGLKLTESKRYSENIVEVQESYQNEKILLEKQQVQYDLELSKSEIDQIDFRNRMLIVFSVLVVIILVILIVFYTLQRKSNKILKIKNKEKDILLKEVNHRVKNNMMIVSSVLALQEGKAKDLRVKQTLKDAGERINALSLAHQKLYMNDDFANIQMKDYLRLICESILRNSSIDFQLYIEESLSFDIEKGQATGFVINELLTNSVKHAWNEKSKNKKIMISIIGDIDTGEIVYKDNGVGFTQNHDFNEADSLGFILIKSFVNRQLQGEFVLSSLNGAQVNISYA